MLCAISLIRFFVFVFVFVSYSIFLIHRYFDHFSLVVILQEEITQAFKKMALTLHPDKGGDECEFIRVKEAYDHLVDKKGIGNQRNEKYSCLEKIENGKGVDLTNSGVNKGKDQNGSGYDFSRRLICVVSDFGTKGFPIDAIPRRWNQIWPDSPFPTDLYITSSNKSGFVRTKKVKLFPYLQHRGKEVCYFKEASKGGGNYLAFLRDDVSISIS